MQELEALTMPAATLLIAVTTFGAAAGAVALAAGAGPSPPPPSRLETILWWLPPVSIAAVVTMVSLEVAQSLPEGSRPRRLVGTYGGYVTFGVAVIVLLNAWRAADIVGFI